jgi:hypothetical protein
MMAHRFVEVALLALNELIEHSTGGAGAKGAPNATGRGGASQGGQGGVDAATLERFEEHVERLVRVAFGCVAREPALLVDDKHRACVGATHGSKRFFFFSWSLLQVRMLLVHESRRLRSAAAVTVRDPFCDVVVRMLHDAGAGYLSCWWLNSLCMHTAWC